MINFVINFVIDSEDDGAVVFAAAFALAALPISIRPD
jgi:hypothetical protein